MEIKQQNFWAASLMRILPLVLLGVLIYFIIQRRFNPRGNKRLATLFWALLLGIPEGAAYLIYRFKMPDWWLIPAFFLMLMAGFLLRARAFPFTRNCPECGEPFSPLAFFMKERCDRCEKNQE